MSKAAINPKLPLKILSSLFNAVQKKRAAAYNQGILTPVHIKNAKVVSIGNIAAGGRGKSPFALFIANFFLKKEIQPAILLRGYKGKMEFKGGAVSYGDGPVAAPDQSGDEAWQASFLSRNILVFAGANRAKQAKAAVKEGAEIIILDDGFQHRSIHRDIDIVIIAPGDIDPKSNTLPAGHLREKKDALKRADLICGNSIDWKEIKNSSHYPDLFFKYTPSFIVSKKGVKSKIEPFLNKYKKVHLISAIERPVLFEKTVKEAGFTVTSHSIYKDHHVFTKKELNNCIKKAHQNEASAILTTVKDLARLLYFDVELNIVALVIDIKITKGKEKLKELIDNI